MNWKIIGYALGRLFQVNGMIMTIPLLIAIVDSYRKNGGLNFSILSSNIEIHGFLLAIAVSLIAGTIILKLSGKSRDIQQVREGFAIVTFGWIFLALLGSIPLTIYFYFLKTLPSYGNPGLSMVNAYFEAMSGFTTTGSTILTDIESLPKSLLFWRSLTHWLGGMGIVTLALAIFPTLGISGYNMFKGEVPGPTAERLQPRLAETAKILWGVYALFSLVETILLYFGGMTLFDALCHTFGTMATGGFSTKNASIAAFNSSYIDWVIIIFMFFAGMNFLIHYRVLRGQTEDLFTNKELHFYTIIVVSAIIIFTGVLFFGGLGDYDNSRAQFRYSPLSDTEFQDHYAEEGSKIDSFYGSLRYSAFQILSIVTTTGYATTDFDLWPNFLRIALVLLMFFGGCAGSTGGGMKMIRILVVFKTVLRELRIIAQPRLVKGVKIDGCTMDEKNIANILSFFILFIILFCFFSLAMNVFIPDLTTAVTSVVATMGNIGPGLSGVGAVENFNWIPIPGKIILIFCMLLGRLEVFTVIILFIPRVWKQ